MSYPSPWGNAINVVRHHYYNKKSAFEMKADFYEEWAAFAVEDGRFTYRIGDSEGVASSGQIVVCPPGVMFHRHTDKPITFHYALFHWTDGTGSRIADEEYNKPLCMSFRLADRFFSSLSTLRAPSDERHPAYRQWLDHIWLDLFRLHAMEQAVPAESHSPAAPDAQMEQAKQLLDAACDQPVAIGAVADLFKLSPVQFSRRFQRAFGMKPSAYVERLKLAKACHLLTHTGMTLEQIALACGFSNGFYLSRYFSIKMGMPPSQYRAQFKV